MQHGLSTALTAIAAFSAGCQGAGDRPSDFGPPDVGPRTVVHVPHRPAIPWHARGVPDLAAPDIPWLEAGAPPIEWSCHDGWHEVVEHGIRTCHPFPGGGARPCEAGTAQLHGEASCAPIVPCPDGDFPAVDDLPAGTPVFYVQRGAPAGGDGSVDAPFRGLFEALDRVEREDEAWLVLGRGPYFVDREWPDGVSIRGRCPLDTSLRLARGSPLPAVLHVPRHDQPIRIEGVRIGPADVGAVEVLLPGVPVTLDGVEVRDVVAAPALHVVLDGHVVARRLVVRDLAPVATGWPKGIQVGRRGRLELSHAVVERSRGVGVEVREEGAFAQLSDLTVRDTRPRADGTAGYGLLVTFGAEADIRRTLVSGSYVSGIRVEQEDTRATLDEVVVEDTRSWQTLQRYGEGLYVAGSRAEVRRTALRRNRGVAVRIVGTGTEVLGRGIAVMASLPEERDFGRATALGVFAGATADLERIVLVGNRAVGLDVGGDGTSARVSDLLVRGTRVTDDDRVEIGALRVEDGAELELRRVLLDENDELGMVVLGTDVEATDLVIQNTRSVRLEGASGLGAIVADAGRLTVARAAAQWNRSAALVATDASTLVGSDLVIRDTGPNRAGTLGIGVVADDGAQVDLSRSVLRGHPFAGLLAEGEGSRATLSDVAIRDNGAAGTSGLVGHGLRVLARASATADRLVVAGCRGYGIEVAGASSSASLRDVEVSSTASAADGEGGGGVSAFSGATLTLIRAQLVNNRETGLLVSGTGGADGTATATVTDLTVLGTMRPDCQPECGGRPDGVSLAVYGSADVDVTSFELARGLSCGVHLTEQASLDLADGVVRGHPIGICLQAPGYPPSRLDRGVDYIDNRQLLDTSRRPAPDPGTVLPVFPADPLATEE
ncbi:MAG: hypothetical protein ACFCGT_21105 [Sandaracinaceae bacterium]